MHSPPLGTQGRSAIRDAGSAGRSPTAICARNVPDRPVAAMRWPAHRLLLQGKSRRFGIRLRRDQLTNTGFSAVAGPSATQTRCSAVGAMPDHRTAALLALVLDQLAEREPSAGGDAIELASVCSRAVTQAESESATRTDAADLTRQARSFVTAGSPRPGAVRPPARSSWMVRGGPGQSAIPKRQIRCRSSAPLSADRHSGSPQTATSMT